MTDEERELCALVFQLTDAYEARFGVPPCFMRMSADIHVVSETLQAALATGVPIVSETADVEYPSLPPGAWT